MSTQKLSLSRDEIEAWELELRLSAKLGPYRAPESAWNSLESQLFSATADNSPRASEDEFSGRRHTDGSLNLEDLTLNDTAAGEGKSRPSFLERLLGIRSSNGYTPSAQQQQPNAPTLTNRRVSSPYTASASGSKKPMQQTGLNQVLNGSPSQINALIDRHQYGGRAMRPLY